MICAPATARPVSERELGPEGRERCEDGADDHTPARQTRSLCLKISGGAGTVSRGVAASTTSLRERCRFRAESRGPYAESLSQMRVVHSSAIRRTELD